MRILRFFLILLMALAVWEAGWWAFGVEPVAPWTAREMLASENPPVIIDVRSQAEFTAFHIPGAVNVPFPARAGELAGASPDPTRAVVVVCMTGHRSPPMASMLGSVGYEKAFNLVGGMAGWKLTGGETVSGN